MPRGDALGEDASMSSGSGSIEELISRMEALLAVLEGRGDALRYFHATYLRTTRAVATEVAGGGFVDRAWTERWDVAFADLYLEALEQWIRGDTPALPWKIASRRPPTARSLPCATCSSG